MEDNIEVKAPSDAVIPDALPQEMVTGDILKGYGPRRGNLERLLRYWRPIMRKEGGFRRCRVILANHPELYPLERICAWLHHETTGLWPNEGCHHPGMKNCRNKLKKGNWSNAQFAARIRKISGGSTPAKGKSADAQQSGDIFFAPHETYSAVPIDVVTTTDFKHAMDVLSEFMEMESEFVKYLRDPNSWETEGEDEFGQTKSLPFEVKSLQSECCGGELIDD
jgi:hypothetical protein